MASSRSRASRASGGGDAQQARQGDPPDRRRLLVALGQQGPRHCLVDLLEARVTVLAGSGPLARRRLAQMAAEALEGRWSAPCPVYGVNLPELGPASCSLAEAERAALASRDPLLVVAVRQPDGGDDARLELLARETRRRGAAAILTDHLGIGAEVVLPLEVPPLAGVTEGSAVEVALLGPIEIRGGAASLTNRPKLTELVVYLALHPGGVTTANWTAALWPDRLVPEQTANNRLSEARGLLGFANDGRRRLRREGDRHLLCEVRTDWQCFARLAGRGEPDAWRAALELVRGRPLEGLLERPWCLYDGTLAEIETAIVECTMRLGQALLRRGDADGAQWAAIRGLKACPFDERLHRLAMRAADAAGNRTGVEAVFRDLAIKLELDGDLRRRLHPQTVALYERLGGAALSSTPRLAPASSGHNGTRSG